MCVGPLQSDRSHRPKWAHPDEVAYVGGTHTHKQTYTYTITQCYFDTVSNVAAILLLEATFFVLCRIFDLVFDCSNSVLFSVAVVVVVVGFLVLCCIFSCSLLLGLLSD